MPGTKQAKRDARQLLRLCRPGGVLDERLAERLVQRIVREKPRGALPMLVEFERLLKLEYARRTATIESATPLSPEQAADVQRRLERAYGPGLRISFTHNPALLGGMRITIGSDVFDGSVQGRLAALEERFS